MNMNKPRKGDIIGNVAMICFVGLLMYLGSVSFHQANYIPFLVILIACVSLVIFVSYFFGSR